MASSRKSLADFLQSVPGDVLKKECNDEHLIEIAAWITNYKDFSAYLGLTEEQEAEIDANGNNLVRKRLDMLRMWRKVFASRATYQKLADVFYRCNRSDLVEKLCNLITPPPPVTNGAGHSGPSLHDLLSKVTVAAKWRMIGIGLHIPTEDLDTIQTNTAGLPNSAVNALQKVFETWRAKSPPATYSWRTIIDVLKSTYVGELRLAGTLEREFL